MPYYGGKACMTNTIKNVFAKMKTTPTNVVELSKDKVFDVYLTIGQILSIKNFIDFIPQEYQRKYIAKFNEKFLEGIARTLFCRDLNYDITQMHLRIFPDGKQKVMYDGETRNFNQLNGCSGANDDNACSRHSCSITKRTWPYHRINYRYVVERTKNYPDEWC
mgnify:CR=1 FL=1